MAVSECPHCCKPVLVAPTMTGLETNVHKDELVLRFRQCDGVFVQQLPCHGRILMRLDVRAFAIASSVS